MSDSVNYDELEREASNQIKINLKEKKEERPPKITDGWHKGPFIVAGIIAAVLIIGSLVFLNWPV